MAEESAKQDVQVSVGKDFVIMGTDRVEVSPDGMKVTAYTNGGVERRGERKSRLPAFLQPAVPPPGETVAKDTQTRISADFSKVVLMNGVTIERAADGHLVISAPGDIDKQAAPANDTPARAALEIGAVALAGDHKGEIYGGILPSDNKPIWFLAAPKSMDHFNAASWATEQGGALPTRRQGDYLTTLKGKGGAFTDIFNRGDSFTAGYVWLAEPSANYRGLAWCLEVRSGSHIGTNRNFELPVLCVRR